MVSKTKTQLTREDTIGEVDSSDDKPSKLSLLEFCKKYVYFEKGGQREIFKPTKYQEQILQYLAEGIVPHRDWYKTLAASEFTCGRLLVMEEGDEFILVSPEGARRFVLKEVAKCRSTNTNLS